MGAVLLLEHRRGPKRIPDGRRQFDLFPKFCARSGVWLYALGLPDGRTKIGIASRPRSRMGQYWNAHGGIAWAHLCAKLPGTDRARHAEGIAVRHAAEFAERIGRSEFFRGLSRQQAIEACRHGVSEEARIYRWMRSVNKRKPGAA